MKLAEWRVGRGTRWDGHGLQLAVVWVTWAQRHSAGTDRQRGWPLWIGENFLRDSPFPSHLRLGFRGHSAPVQWTVDSRPRARSLVGIRLDCFHGKSGFTRWYGRAETVYFKLVYMDDVRSKLI
jgi:hypothetical protein